MISTIEFKKHVIGASILGIIIGKFCYKKKPCLVILFKINKGLKVRFYYTILLFDLTVCLWIKGVGESPLNTKEIV